MAKNATLTFGMDLSDFDKAMKAINKQSNDLSTQLGRAIKAPIEAYKNGLKELKINPLNIGAREQVAKLAADIKKATTTKLNLDISNARKNIEGLKTDIIAALGSVLVLSKPISAAIDFESSMADVKKVVDFGGENDVKNFSNDLMKMSRTIPLSVNELAQITASGGQLGIAKENLLDFTSTAAKMGVAFDMSAKEAGDNMATLMNIFGMDVKQVGALGDTINHISNNSAATAGDIVNALGRIAGNAKDFGLSADATAGLASSFIALGKAPEVASTAINSMLTVLNNADNASKEVSEAFKQIGIDGKDLKRAILKDPQKALTQFLHTLSKIPKAQKTGILTAIFGKNFGDDISLVTGAIENFDKAMALSGDKAKAGSMQREFEARSATTASNIQLMKSAFNEIAINIGSVFLPVINSALNVIRKVSYVVSEFTAKFPGLTKAVFGAVVAITTLKVAFLSHKLAVNAAIIVGGEFRKVLSVLPFECLKAGGSLGTCSLKFKNLGFAMASARLQTSLFFSTLITRIKAFSLALITSPIGLFLTALAIAAALVYKYWDEVKAFFDGFFEGVKMALRPFIQSFKDAWEHIKGALSLIVSLFERITSAVGSSAGELGNLKNEGVDFGRVFGTAISALLYPLEAIANIITAIGLVIDIVKLKGSEWIEAFTKKIEWLMDKVSMVVDAFSLVKDGAKEVLGIGDGKENNWYNPFSWFNDETPAQTTNGAIDQAMQDKRIAQVSAASSKQINDNKKIDIHMHGTQATPQAVAVAIEENGYSFGD